MELGMSGSNVASFVVDGFRSDVAPLAAEAAGVEALHVRVDVEDKVDSGSREQLGERSDGAVGGLMELIGVGEDAFRLLCEEQELALVVDEELRPPQFELVVGYRVGVQLL